MVSFRNAGAGMVIFQPSTHHVVVVEDEPSREWFLPKGRKDVGESLEQAAVREAYEEVYICSSLAEWNAPTAHTTAC
jgi:8-oxo-dGTP pyrophosphatase MutT (NUDIX family)